MGCYRNNEDDRILTYLKLAFGELTPEFCVNHCLTMGYQYAGPEVSGIFTETVQYTCCI